jgi:hypothetical protein
MRTSITLVGTSALVGALLSLAITAASAAPIPVNNFSFEAVPPGGFPFTAGCVQPGCSYSEGVGAIPGWTSTVPSLSGEFIPGTQVGNFFAFDIMPDGITGAFIGSPGIGTISQTVGTMVQVGVTYTLEVDLGWRKDYPAFTGTADLLVNGTRYVASGVMPVHGNWSTFTATYTGLAVDAGDPITIELNNSNNSLQADFDDVRLSSNIASVVPEPASIGMLGVGLIGLLVFTRRKRACKLDVVVRGSPCAAANAA